MLKEMMRGYRMPDSTMLMGADVFHTFFVEDETDFFNFSNGMFPATYKTDFQAEIDAARETLTDIEVVGNQMQETTEFLQKKKESEQQVQEVKLFVKKAFPGNKDVWHQFGFDNYNKARYMQHDMVNFVALLARTAKKYKNQLIAVGYTQIKINALQTLANDLKQQEMEQEDAKLSRPVLTRTRIIALNKPWNRMVEIHKASRIIYRDNYEKLHQYDLPKGSVASARNIVAIADLTVLQVVELGIRGTKGKIVTVLYNGQIRSIMMDGVSTPFFNLEFTEAAEQEIKIINDVKEITECHSNNSRLTSFRIPRTMKKLKLLVLQNNLMKTKAVDQTLIDVNNLGTYGVIVNLIGNEPPSVDGLIAKSELEARGCTVLVS